MEAIDEAIEEMNINDGEDDGEDEEDHSEDPSFIMKEDIVERKRRRRPNQVLIVDREDDGNEIKIIPRVGNNLPKVENRGKHKTRMINPKYNVQKIVGETEDGLQVVDIGNFTSIQEIADKYGVSYSKMYRVFKRTDKMCLKILITKLDKK